MKHSIKLFIHDSFFDAFSLLPRKIQKKTREFMKKFKEDPTSSAINYEKISSFIDQSLRTVRIDQKYRAIVQAPSEGNGFHLLWVDNHDEAMDWAKNKKFEWNKSTQSFQTYDQPNVVEVMEKQEELLFHSFSDDQLIALGTPKDVVPLIRTIKSLEDLEKSTNNIPQDAYEYLYYLAEGISLEELLDEIKAGLSEENELESINARKHVYTLTDDKELEQILSGDFEKWKIFLHPSQRNLAYKDYKGPMKITGGAGTGKTVCAFHRTKYLRGNLGAFDKPVLFTTYTKSLTKYLNTIAESFSLSDELVVIQNFDKLVIELAKNPEFQVIDSSDGMINSSQELELWKEVIEYTPTKFDEKFLQGEYNDVILENSVESVDQYFKASRTGRSVRIGRKDKQEIWGLIEDFIKVKGQNHTKLELCQKLISFFDSKVDKPFSHLICDEVQDFSNLELSLMRKLIEEKPNDLFFVGDPFQNIYGRKVNFSKSGINVRGRRSRKLKVNYRTTEEIKKKAINVISAESYDNFDGEEESKAGYVSLMHGTQPSYQIFETLEEEDQFVISQVLELLKDERIEAREICLSGRTNKVVDQLKKLLNENNVKAQDISSSKESNSAVRVSTFHNLKGHEFKHLFVCGVSKDEVPFRHPEFDNYNELEMKQYLKQERSLYYVVFSRAIQNLWITGVGEKSDWF